MDVTDLFDGFHRLAGTLWRDFGLLLAPGGGDEDDEGITFDAVVDQLELDVFLGACARRVREQAGRQLEPDDLATMIRVLGPDGPLPGPAGRYHSHAFHPETFEGDVPRAILCADLMARELGDLRLVVTGERERGRTPRRGALPMH